jgi:putative redox protein
VEVDDFNMKVEGTLTEEHPKQFTSMHIIYEFSGTDLPIDKIKRAIELSQEKYCGVSATLKKAIPITYEILIQAH